jgi:hypothetical protein
MTQEALKLALPLLEDCVNSYGMKYERPAFVKAIIAVKEALTQPEQPKVRTGDCLLVGVCASEGHKIQKAQPEQEPVADDFFKMIADRNPKPFLLPQRTWVGLTNEEAMDVTRKEGHELLDFIYEYGTGVEGIEERIVAICKAIEAKLKEKNT